MATGIPKCFSSCGLQWQEEGKSRSFFLSKARFASMEPPSPSGSPLSANHQQASRFDDLAAQQSLHFSDSLKVLPPFLLLSIPSIYCRSRGEAV